MKWLPLKIFQSHLIAQEVDVVSEKYTNLNNEIKKTHDSSKMDEFNQLKFEISNRIDELNQFYEYHANDQRISKFERIIYKLKKLLNSDFDQQKNNEFSNIYNLNNTNNVINHSGLNEINHLNKNFESIYSKKFSSEANNRTNSAMNNKNTNEGQNEMSNYETGKDSLFGAKQVNSKNNHVNNNNTNKNSSVRSNTANKGTYGRSNSVENNRNKNQSDYNNRINNKNTGNNTGNSNINLPKMDVLNDDMVSWKEIVFKIRLTEAEYKLLLKEKSKGVINFK